MLASRIKPLSYLKAHATQVIDDLEDSREPLVVTQNGEAKMVVMDVATYEQSQQTLALMKILALGQQQIAEGKTFDARKALGDIHSLDI